MIHALAYVLFIVPFTTWLGYELGLKFKLRKYWIWIAGAVIAGLVGSAISEILLNSMTGNFILHASGGVSSVFLFIYLTKTLRLSFVNWRVTLLVLFAFVCMLGVLNELAEFLFELITPLTFSVDSQDTWRDFVANTFGAALAWMIYKSVQTIKSKI